MTVASDQEANQRPGGIAMPLWQVRLGLGQLRTLSPEERSLLFQFGSAANQIAMLSRLAIFSSNEDTTEQPMQKLSAAQTQMLARLAIGVLVESWEMTRRCFIERPIAQEYIPLLDATGQLALTTLKRHFGQSNLLHKLRNTIVFHQPSTTEVEAAFEVAASDPEFTDEWNVYLARSHLSAFYFASDIIVLHAMKAASGEPDLVAAQNKIMGEIGIVSPAMIEFIYAFFAALWRKNFGLILPVEVCADLARAPDLFKVQLPVLVQEEPSVDGEA